jgi:carbon storage regulator
MLVLSRKQGERILIGDQISVTVVRINGGAVRLGVNAPAHLSVIREELKERMQRALQQSSAETEDSATENSVSAEQTLVDIAIDESAHVPAE